MSTTLEKAKAKARELRKALREIEKLTRGGTAADRHRDRMAERMREQSSTVADIGELPTCVNPERKEACRLNLQLFLETYFPASTGLSPFSKDHERVIARLQRCILEGGRFINAVYRGFAKTTISVNAALWAALYGHRRSIVVFSCNDGQASALIDSIKMELAENELLSEDFPEVCHAVKALDGIAQRAKSQHYRGRKTHIVWTSERVVLPTIAGFKCGGCAMTSRGITASNRGMVHTTGEGTRQRPDFVIIDDPQTDESAATPAQVSKRLNVIKKSILKLAGHGKEIACVINATVIQPDDLVEQLLDPKRNPAWQGERIKMVRAWSDEHDSLWLGKYAEIRNDFDREDPEDQRRARRDATEFYLLNRVLMDTGCVVSWEHCYSPDSEISAIQHAYNMLIDDGADVFASECQNEPLVLKDAADRFLTAFEIQQKVTGYARGEFPTECTTITSFIDVGDEVLWWGVAAWAPDFTGYVIDYGSWPDQGRVYYGARDLRVKLADLYPNMGVEAAIMAGLTDLANRIAGRVYRRDDGAIIPLTKLLVDSGDNTQTIYAFTRQSAHRAVMLPSKGFGVKAGNVQMSERKAKPGETVGADWVIHPLANNKAIRLAEFDTNSWKTFTQTRFATAHGDRGSLGLFNANTHEHRMFAEHMTAEKPVRTEGRGRQLWEWQLPANKPDNHLLDVCVGMAVAASMAGIILPASQQKDEGRKRLKLSEIYKAKHGGRR